MNECRNLNRKLNLYFQVYRKRPQYFSQHWYQATKLVKYLPETITTMFGSLLSFAEESQFEKCSRFCRCGIFRGRIKRRTCGKEIILARMRKENAVVQQTYTTRKCKHKRKKVMKQVQ